MSIEETYRKYIERKERWDKIKKKMEHLKKHSPYRKVFQLVVNGGNNGKN